jgi:uncharacterized membrane protein SirB2
MAILNALIFLGLSTLHFYWLLGGKWGLDSAVPQHERSGNKVFVPSVLSTLLVATGLLGFAFIELGNTTLFSGWMELKYFHWGNLVIAFIFLARAIGDFRYVGFFKRIRNTEFAQQDTRYFTPLCLYIATTSILIVVA